MKTREFRTPAKNKSNIITFTCSDGAVEPVLELLGQMRAMGSMGCSRRIIVEWGGRGEDKAVFFDGDGNHKLSHISVNGLTLEEWDKEWKRLDENAKRYEEKDFGPSVVSESRPETPNPKG